MEFVNLTPHTINLIQKRLFPPSGTIARCKEISKDAGKIDGVPLIYRRYVNIEGLPEPKDDVIYIVSHIVRTALPRRKDLISPGDLFRDNDGNIIGCTNFIRN